MAALTEDCAMLENVEMLVITVWEDIETGAWNENIDPFGYLLGARSLVAYTVGFNSPEYELLTLAHQQLSARVYYGADNFRRVIAWR